MEYYRSVIEHWTYRWEPERQQYVRSAYRPMGVVKPFNNPRETVQEFDPQPAVFLSAQTLTTETLVRYSDTNSRAPTFVVPVLPTRSTATASPPLRPPASPVRSPVTIRLNNFLGQTYFTDGTLTVPTPGPSTATGAPTVPSASPGKRTRDRENQDPPPGPDGYPPSEERSFPTVRPARTRRLLPAPGPLPHQHQRSSFRTLRRHHRRSRSACSSATNS